MSRVLAIGVAARSLRTFRGGVDLYVESIIRHGAPLAAARRHRFVVYVDDAEVARKFEGVPGEVAVVPMGLLGRLGWDHLSTPARARADGLDVLISPRSFRPMWLPCASVVLVYDMMYFDCRQWLLPRDNGAYFRGLHRLSLHRSEAIVTFSAFSRDRVVANVARVRAGQVRVLPPGPPDPGFRPPAQGAVDAALASFHLAPPYLLAVGAHPRKNLGMVVEALASTPPPVTLAVVSPSFDPAERARLERLAASHGLSERVKFLEAIPKAQLAALYGGALATVYASSYEGIGMPPVEAMACGCPVVCASAASIPEVVGEAALSVPPGDAPALARAVNAIFEDPALAAELREKGRARAGLFDWERTVAALLDLAESVAGAKS